MSVEFNFQDFFQPIILLKFRSLFQKTPWQSREDLVDFQEKKIRKLVRHAYDHVPYYRSLFKSQGIRPEDVRTLADFSRLPLLTKKAVRENRLALQADNQQRFRPRLHHTSGTSGRKLEFLLDRATNALEFAYYWRNWNWAGYRLGAPFAEFSSTFFMKVGRENDLVFQERGTGRLLLSSVSFSGDIVRRLVLAVKAHKARFLKGLPSVLFYFAQFLKSENLGALSLQAVFSQGETLYPFQRRELENTFGCKVYNSYGQMERVVGISECPEGSLHINLDYGLLELIPLPSDSPNEFRARMVGSSLYNFSMPFLRYDLGDTAVLERTPRACPCGRSFPTVRFIEGRTEDVIVTPDGRIATTLFLAFDETPHILGGQIIQESPESLVVCVKPSRQFLAQDQEKLLAYIRQGVGHSMKIRLRILNEKEDLLNPAGKFKVITSLVKQPFQEAVSSGCPSDSVDMNGGRLNQRESAPAARCSAQ